jgi:hypothetical protein
MNSAAVVGRWLYDVRADYDYTPHWAHTLTPLVPLFAVCTTPSAHRTALTCPPHLLYCVGRMLPNLAQQHPNDTLEYTAS